MNPQTTKEAARQSMRAGQEHIEGAALDAGHTDAEILQQNAGAYQRMWDLGLALTRQMMERSADQVARMMDMPVDGGRAEKQPSAEVTMSFGNVVQQTAREWFDLSQQGMQRSLDLMTKLVSCRTPQQIVAVQTEFLLGNVESLAQSGRKLTELSKVAGERARSITEKGRRTA